MAKKKVEFEKVDNFEDVEDFNSVADSFNDIEKDTSVVAAREEKILSNIEASMNKFNMENHVKESKAFSSSSYYYIKPYVIKDNETDGGLSKYGMVVKPECVQTEEMSCIERGEQVMYVNGLNEFSNDVQNMPEGEEKQAKIEDIRRTVQELEYKFGNHQVASYKDSNFWATVKYMDPFNPSMWEKRTLSVSNIGEVLNPNDKDDLITIKAIEGGGYSLVAPSYEDAKAAGGKYRFYLDKEEVTAEYNVSSTTKFFECGTILNDLKINNPDKLFYMLKLLAQKNTSNYRKTTPPGVLFDALSNYIQGNGSDRKNVAIDKFLEHSKMSDGDLMLRAYVKDAERTGIIIFTEGNFVLREKGVILGTNINSVYSYFAAPGNADIYKELRGLVNIYW